MFFLFQLYFSIGVCHPFAATVTNNSSNNLTNDIDYERVVRNTYTRRYTRAKREREKGWGRVECPFTPIKSNYSNSGKGNVHLIIVWPKHVLIVDPCSSLYTTASTRTVSYTHVYASASARACTRTWLVQVNARVTYVRAFIRYNVTTKKENSRYCIMPMARRSHGVNEG